MRRGYTALFTKTFRLLREIKDTYDPDADVGEHHILSRLQNLNLLVIDDLGVQFRTNTERMILFEILDSRYEHMMPTILTTKLPTLSQIEALLGQRIVDRFFRGDSQFVLFDWESYRRSNQARSLVSTNKKCVRPTFLKAGRREV